MKTDYQSMLKRIVSKMNARRHLGFFDHCSDSWDMCVARARTERILKRVNSGERITLHQAIYF